MHLMESSSSTSSVLSIPSLSTCLESASFPCQPQLRPAESLSRTAAAVHFTTTFFCRCSCQSRPGGCLEGFLDHVHATLPRQSRSNPAHEAAEPRDSFVSLKSNSKSCSVENVVRHRSTAPSVGRSAHPSVGRPSIPGSVVSYCTASVRSSGHTRR